MHGETIAGRYRLLEPLGRGAMSAVWLAQDDELERRVAVKMLAPTADPARFEREARAAASLSHPNLCALYDYGEADDRPYMVLEYLPNGSLEERLRPGEPLADAETLRIATEVAAGLAHAHERGLVHRDLKPANILFDSEERAKIADFGIARMGDAGTLTEAGTVLGTASYISPEQAAGLPAGPASDIYSFGVILFRMLTGAFPFVSQNAMELVRMHRDDPPRTVADARPDAPAHLASIVTASLAKDPAARPPDGAALLRALRSSDETGTLLVTPAAAETQVLRPRTPAKRRRSPLLPLAALAAVLLVAGGALATVLTNHGSGNGGGTTGGLTLPNVPTANPTAAATSTFAPATSSARTTTATTTPPVTTAPVTTAIPPTTAPTATTTSPTTSAPPTTTAPVTTADTTPTTTVPSTTTTATP